MGEYQYFEFRALDKPLTKAEMAKLRECSSRAEITPTSFQVVYNWGDFKGNVDEWMARYFDVFVHVAGWGTRWLALRVPSALLREAAIDPYQGDLSVWAKETEGNLVLHFRVDERESSWEEDSEDWLPSLLPLRDELMDGDLRSLYLGWLASMQWAEAEDDSEEDLAEGGREPPVPAGLGDLTAAQEALVDFLEISPHLLAAAAEGSPPRRDGALTAEEVQRWAAGLPVDEARSLLGRLVLAEEQHLTHELRRQARGGGAGAVASGPRRTVATLEARAEEIEAAAKRAEQEGRKRAAERARLAEEAERERRLASRVGKQEALWREATALATTGKAKGYGKAVDILIDLRELATRDGSEEGFVARLDAFRATHAKRPALLRRIGEAGL